MALGCCKKETTTWVRSACMLMAVVHGRAEAEVTCGRLSTTRKVRALTTKGVVTTRGIVDSEEEGGGEEVEEKGCRRAAVGKRREGGADGDSCRVDAVCGGQRPKTLAVMGAIVRGRRKGM